MPVQLKDKVLDLKKEIDSEYCKKNGIYILKGVEYNFDRGMTFIENYREYDNIID
jgi:hypothetical protein